MNDGSEPVRDEAENDTVRLLQLAGPREHASAARASRVKSAVHAEWQARARRRARRRRSLAAATILAAASMVLVIGRFNRIDRQAVPLGEMVAVVEQVEGAPRRAVDAADAATGAIVSRKEAIRIGEWITTDSHARVALRFTKGASVRLDAASRVRPLSSTMIELAAGAVYIDTEGEAGRLEVQTAWATARDIGTQFEVRLLDRSVRLRVRTGIVELSDRRRSVSGRAGTEITLSASGAASRPIAAHGAEWDWTARVSPHLDMEGMSTAAFLENVAREHGWVVHYTDQGLAQEASQIILHGSVSGLAPEEMIRTAIAASGLDHRFESGALRVLRATPAKEIGRDR
jgi:ferric-dicitrate binding protein FerR (iron transport regulator)